MKSRNSAESLSEELKKFWTELEMAGKNGPKPNFLKHVFNIVFSTWIASVAYYALDVFASFYLLQLVIDQAVGILDGSKDLPLPVENGYAVAALVLATQVLSMIAQSLILNNQREYMQMLDAVVASALFQKSFRLSPKARHEFDEGQILNLIASDSTHISVGLHSFNLCWSLVVKLTVSLFILISKLGVLSAVLSLSIVALVLALTFGTAGLIEKYFTMNFLANDSRVSRLREALLGKLI